MSAAATLQRTDVAARAVEATKVYGSARTPDGVRAPRRISRFRRLRRRAARATASPALGLWGDTAVVALDEVSVEFPTGRFTAIMGPSGSGKSTLMHVVAGLDTLTEGQVFIGDVELGTLSDKELTLLRRTQVGFVFQAFNLVPTLTACENVVLPLSLAGAKPDRAWVDEVIDTVGLRDRLKHRPSELSGGQQQRVAVARALASRPRIVFADEPTGNVDSRAGGEILGFLRRAVDEMGQTIVMVTHDPVAASYADRALFLADGRIVGQLDDPTPPAVLDRIKELGD
jgi:putative ABC transport system ATP-binding protein